MNMVERLLRDNNLPSTDRDGPRSNPYRPTEMACEACCFGRGEHADFCEFWLIPPAAITRDGENAVVNLNVWYAENKRAWDKEWQDYIDGCFHAG